MLNLISSVLQQECKQESESLDKGRITGSAPPPKKLPLPLNGGRSHAFSSFLDLGRSARCQCDFGPPLRGPATPVPNPTRSSAIAEGTRDAPCQLNLAKNVAQMFVELHFDISPATGEFRVLRRNSA